MRTLIACLFFVGIANTPVLAHRWVALWTEDDSYVGMNDSGDVWQLVPGNDPIPAGHFGPGPWVGFSKSWSDHRHYALKANGEIWVLPHLGGSTPAVLFLSLPGDREWCALLTAPEGGYGPGHALACNGEVWALMNPPEYAGTFGNPPVSRDPGTWGAIKQGYRR